MAGALTVDTLNSGTGVLATQNGMTGVAKAWVAFNGTTGAINGTAFNVSSVTRAGTGQFAINFTTAMVNANYAVSSSCSAVALAQPPLIWHYGNQSGASTYTAPTTSTYYVSILKYDVSAYVEPTLVTTMVLGA
jgi:hypothetical protein